MGLSSTHIHTDSCSDAPATGLLWMLVNNAGANTTFLQFRIFASKGSDWNSSIFDSGSNTEQRITKMRSGLLLVGGQQEAGMIDG